MCVHVSVCVPVCVLCVLSACMLCVCVCYVLHVYLCVLSLCVMYACVHACLFMYDLPKVMIFVLCDICTISSAARTSSDPLELEF